MKIALYRKYRPKQFADVVGQDAVVAALKNQIKNERIGHSYIFTGIRGTGKTSFAKILAKAVNCPNAQEGEPCGVCDICVGIDNGSMLDVTEIDAASNSGVDNVRALREETAYYPAVCKMRVYIIDEVHMLTREAFNALLKIMEEPPAHVLFILATTEVHKVPATILSRCQRFDLRRISNEDIVKRLTDIAQKEDMELTPEAAALIARLADGAMRDALSLLDTCSSMGGRVDEAVVAELAGVADKSYLFELANDIAAKDLQALFGRLAALYAGSVDPTRLCLELIRHYRNLLMVKVSGVSALKDCSAQDIEQYKAQAAKLDGRDILRALDELSATADKMTAVPDRMLALELSFVKLCAEGAAALPKTDETPWEAPKSTAKEPPKQDVQTKPETIEKQAVTEPQVPLSTEDDVPWEVPVPAQRKDSIKAEPEEIETVSEPRAEEKQASPPKQPVLQVQGASDGPQLLERWDEVVDALLPQSGMLYAFLKKSRAYLTETHVLIEAEDIFLKHMRENNGSKDIIKEAIFKTTGIKLPIGPYTAAQKPEETAPKQDDAAIEDLLARAQESGVEVEIL